MDAETMARTAERGLGAGDAESTDMTDQRGKPTTEGSRSASLAESADGPGRQSATDSADRTDQEKEATTEVTESTEQVKQPEAGGSTSPAPASERSRRDAERIQELTTESARLRAQIAEARVEQELVWGAEREEAVNPTQVALLMKEHVKPGDDLNPVVIDADGNAVMDEYGQAVTVGDAVRAFLEANPHLVRPTRPQTSSTKGGDDGGSGTTALTGRTPGLTGGELIAEALREGA